jgi:tol-pal system protein YbgF
MLRSAALALTLALSTAPALAGPFDGWLSSPGSDATQAQGQGTVADVMARVQRLEGQNRQLTGQVQELQNALRRTLDDFNRYREDTEYRLQTLEGGKPSAPKRSQAPAPPSGNSVAAASPPGTSQGLGAPPSNLGTLPPNGQDTMMDGGGTGEPMLDDGSSGNPDEPMQLPRYQEPPGASQPSRQTTGLAPPGLPGVAVDQGAGARPAPGMQQQAALPQTPEDEYTADYRLIEGRSYEAAEIAFRKFVQSYPDDKRVPDATHWIGESLFQRQQYRDAAEQFLLVTQKYGSHRRAPSSMLRLGMSLAALGEKEAACATFQEIGRKYPTASASVKSGIDRETKRNGC